MATCPAKACLAPDLLLNQALGFSLTGLKLKRTITMELNLAEAIVAACNQSGVRAELKKDYSASWMRGRQTAGVVITDGDLAKFITALIANADLLVDGEVPRFSIDSKLNLSPYRLSLILY